MKILGVPFILIGGVKDNGDRGLLRRLAGSLLLNYDAAEGQAPSYLVDCVHRVDG